jgi:hypothetical protein
MSTETRYFAYREYDGNDYDETSVFTGSAPRKAALKAARRYAEDATEDEPLELRLRERGTDKVHVYDGWTWEEQTSDSSPDWLPDSVTEANVSKKGVEHDD